jgi:hypothetical protein
VKLDKRKGTATLTVLAPGAGSISLAGTPTVKGAEAMANGAGPASVPIRAAGKAKQKLRKRGKAKVSAAVTFTPQGGLPNTETTSVTLKRKR